jgi:WD40 repeat protein
LELSDVTGFQELPDGKFVSGTEYGTLMLWEGNLIKAHLVLEVEPKKPLHDGYIEFVCIDGQHIITAGADGFIKYWDLSIIDQAEADEIMEVAIEPLNIIEVKDVETD